MNNQMNLPEHGGLCTDMQGTLPACAPLANPYVPFQQKNPKKYEAQKGLVRGTLFPGLDLPFMGKVNPDDLPVTPMHELQAMSFALNELGLYLDTHKEDKEAAEMYQSYSQLYKKALKTYTETYGPLFQWDAADTGSYQWLRDPWPWDYAENKEK